jgi:hypothetical protein
MGHASLGVASLDACIGGQVVRAWMQGWRPANIELHRQQGDHGNTSEHASTSDLHFSLHGKE